MRKNAVAELIFRGADSALVAQALANGASGVAARPGRASPVIAACMRGADKSLEALAAAGVNLLEVGAQGKTSLMYAAWSGSTESAKLLIAAGGSCRDVDKDGWTPLMYAARAGHVDMASLLLPLSNPLAVNFEGKSAWGLSSSGAVRDFFFLAELVAREQQLMGEAARAAAAKGANVRI